MKELNLIQQGLKAPKSQRNPFWKYNYRSCEDILEAVKPLLWKSTLVIQDEIVLIWDRIYVKATATISNGEVAVSAKALAREPDTQKWMNEAQITWSASSYARKYALNGLFAIDDTKDADATNTHWDDEKEKARLNQGTSVWKKCLERRVTPKKITDHFKIKVPLLNKYKAELQKLIDSDG
jgi:hypothetical protein